MLETLLAPKEFGQYAVASSQSRAQNCYNIANRDDDGFIKELARQGIAYVPFFPLGGLYAVAIGRARRDRGIPAGGANADRACMAASARAQHSADSGHIFGQTSLRNLDAATLQLAHETIAALDLIAGSPKQ